MNNVENLKLSPEGETRHQRIVDRAIAEVGKASDKVLAALMRDNLAETHASAAAFSGDLMRDFLQYAQDLPWSDDEKMAAEMRRTVRTALGDESAALLQKSAFASRILANLLVG